MFNISRISSEFSWPHIVSQPPDNYTIQRDYMNQHYDKFNNDFDYLGNFSIDMNAFNVDDKDVLGFMVRGKFNRLIGKKFKVNDSRLKEITHKLGFINCNGSLQNLEPGNSVLSHFDTAHPLKPEKVVSQLYIHLLNNLENFENISIDKTYNIRVLFLDPWCHGQAFMIGRQAFTNWKPGDVIGFPWYMEHSTVNASACQRNMVYIVGSVV